MNPRSNPEIVADLQFALNVISEHSHLGLDDEHTSRLKSILVRQIERAELALGRRVVSGIAPESREAQISA